MRRRTTALATCALFSLILSACSDDPAPPAPSTTAAPTTPAETPSETYTEDGGADATVPGDGATATTPLVVTEVDIESSFLKGTAMNPQRALFTLDALVVASPLPMDGFTEGIYTPGPNAEEAGWPSQMMPARNCSVASATLTRDGQGVQADEQCNITDGSWADPFTREQVTDPSAIAPVYVVPNAEVWRSGGAEWTAEQAGIYGSTQEALVAAISPQDRGDRGPHEWKPQDTSTWCPYAVRWVGVKNEFGLALSSEEEREALREMLGTCAAAEFPLGA